MSLEYISMYLDDLNGLRSLEPQDGPSGSFLRFITLNNRISPSYGIALISKEIANPYFGILSILNIVYDVNSLFKDLKKLRNIQDITKQSGPLAKKMSQILSHVYYIAALALFVPRFYYEFLPLLQSSRTNLHVDSIQHRLTQLSAEVNAFLKLHQSVRTNVQPENPSDSTRGCPPQVRQGLLELWKKTSNSPEETVQALQNLIDQCKQQTSTSLLQPAQGTNSEIELRPDTRDSLQGLCFELCGLLQDVRSQGFQGDVNPLLFSLQSELDPIFTSLAKCSHPEIQATENPSSYTAHMGLSSCGLRDLHFESVARAIGWDVSDVNLLPLKLAAADIFTKKDLHDKKILPEQGTRSVDDIKTALVQVLNGKDVFLKESGTYQIIAAQIARVAARIFSVVPVSECSCHLAWLPSFSLHKFHPQYS